MHLFHKRYLSLFCTIFACTALSVCFFASPKKLIFGMILLCFAFLLALLSVFLLKARSALAFLSFCLLFSSLALLQGYFRVDTERNRLHRHAGQTLETEITVIEKNSVSEWYSSFLVFIELDGHRSKALLECDYQADLSVGDTLCGEFFIDKIEVDRKHVAYFLADSIYIALHSEEDSLRVVDRGYSNFQIRMRAFNTRLSNQLRYTINRECATLISAVSLGNKARLGDDVIRDFQRTGLSHALAVSGMHLSVIMVLAELVLRRLSLRKQYRLLLVFALAFFYMALTGFSLSTVRAFIMMAFVHLSFFVKQDNDAVTSLFFALFLILFFIPTAVWDIGIWMSFLAVLGILVVNELTQSIVSEMYERSFKKWLIRILSYLISAILVSIASNVFVCLPLWLFFGEFSLVTVLSNLIVSPLISLILFITPFYLLISLIPFPAAVIQATAFLLEKSASLILDIVSQLSHWKHATVSLRYPFVGYILIPSFILLCVFLIIPLKRKFWIAVVPLVAVLAFSGCLFAYRQENSDVTTVDFMSLGESEMILISTVDEAAIIDISTGGSNHLYQTAQLSENRFSTELSSLVLTHYHTYHISSLSRNAVRLIIRQLYLPIPKNEDEYYMMQSLIDIAKKNKISVQLYDREDTLKLCKSVDFTLSNAYYLKRSTHPVFALSLTAFGQTLTYLSESAHEETVLCEAMYGALSQSEFVFLGHHGPVTKQRFSLEDISPKYLFVSDPSVLSYLSPPESSKIIIGSTQVSLRFSP